jgi:hypothetical protein
MNLDFSSVTLPGVGGTLNAATAISSDKLEQMNKAGKKWRTDEDGNLTFHNESKLEANKASRERRRNLINRDRNENADSQQAMEEIMSRKKARANAFMELKRKEYNFADDSELMSMPQPFSQDGCSKGCKGPGKCSCSSCKKAVGKHTYREWSDKERQKLQDGKVKGEFAGPNMSFPIAGPQDVSSAWSSVGRAANPRQVMAEIIRISRKYGWTSGLPKSVKDRLDKGESGLPSPEFREWPEEKRVKLKKGKMKGGFAGPGTSFPVSSPEDVSAAWSSVGRADNPKKVMENIIRLAKENGWTSGLPETVKQRLEAGKSGLPE